MDTGIIRKTTFCKARDDILVGESEEWTGGFDVKEQEEEERLSDAFSLSLSLHELHESINFQQVNG